MFNLNQKYQVGIIHYVNLFRERYFMYDQLVNFLLKIFKSYGITDRILSLGCGTCSIETRLAKQGLNIIAIDHDEESLEMARHRVVRNNLRMEIIQGDFFNISMPIQVDAILLLFSALSIDKIVKVVENVNQNLKKNGIFICDLYGWDHSTKSSPSTFIDIFIQDVEDIICISSYFTESLKVEGYEVYLIKNLLSDNIELKVDYTKVPVLKDAEFLLIEKSLNLEKYDLKLDGVWLTKNICPTGAPPFCLQKLILWKKQ